MFRVFALPKFDSEAAARATREADSRACCDMHAARCGVPRTDVEWTALVRVASGELDIPAGQCARLLELGLVERRSGFPELTPHGRLTLGLPE